MNAPKENQDVIHRIDPENSEEISIRFDELVRLLEKGSDEDVTSHLKGFHHSDLADAFGLLPKNLRSRLLESFKEDLDPDLLFEIEDHLRHEITIAYRLGGCRSHFRDDWMRRQVLEDMDEEDREEILNQVPDEERETLDRSWLPRGCAGRRMQTELVSVGKTGCG